MLLIGLKSAYSCTYAEAQTLSARRSLQALDLDYLEIEIREFVDRQSIDSCIDQWAIRYR
ncbi:exocyst complex component EXO70A1 [Prunus yedoensis var. nudiflora]|uniref:Exocyst complex component EXO70A1 n=1 Tax=Prunus yedoensis var. nudiflora TaxID=2094558 RepID=A0A314YAS8_PRUYE|nr:exocyst complex component EXO70A1 [Prunus yedoensis var. nudiflora]